MNLNLERWIVEFVIRPLLLTVKAILAPVDWMLFGWVDRWLARNYEKKLERDIRVALPFLFAEENGSVVPSEGVPFPPGFDYAFVTIRVDNVFIRFCRGRGELDVRVASSDMPNDWHDLGLLLSILDKEDLQRLGLVDLWRVSQLLRPRMDCLKHAFAGSAGVELQQRLSGVYASDKVAIREAEWEINRRLSAIRRR